jgi:hypothetical protein
MDSQASQLLLNNLFGIGVILALVGIAFRLAPKNVSVAGHDAGQLFLLAALPLFFIDYATSAEYAAGELHHYLADHDLLTYAPYGVAVIGALNFIFGSLYIYALGVFRDGGGASTASLRYLGPTVTIMVAFLLFQDYTMTVVVSSLSGADQLLSVFNALDAHPLIHIGIGVVIAWMTCWLTLRGRKDAATVTFVILFVFVALMLITFISLQVQIMQNQIPPAVLPSPKKAPELAEVVGTIARAVLHGLVALTGLEAVSNGLPFIKNQDSAYVKWGKQHLKVLMPVWSFLSGRVGVGRTIQIGFLFYGGLTTLFNSYFANYYNVQQGTNGRTLVGNLAYLGLVPIGGVVLYIFRQIWSALTLSFANMTAYEDIQSTAYRDGVRGIMPLSLVYRSPNGNFPRPVYLTFFCAVIIMFLVNGSTSTAIPFYGIGVFGPISFMGFSVAIHIFQRKTVGWQLGFLFAFLSGILSSIIFVFQIVAKWDEGGWVVLVVFAFLFVGGHIFLISANGYRFDKQTRYFIQEVSRIHGTMFQQLYWQTETIQTYRDNLWQRITHWHRGDERPLELHTMPPYLIHFDDHEEHDDVAPPKRGAAKPNASASTPTAEGSQSPAKG